MGKAFGTLAIIFLMLVSIPLWAMGSPAAAACAIDPAAAAARTGIAGYQGQQLTNAAHIISAGAQQNVPLRGQQIAVMTAMGESSLQVLDHGDAAGPDSRGLFQQRDSWGTLAERLDPQASARLFYERLLAVEGWEDMRPTEAAHTVQVNANPEHYDRFWDAAMLVVDELTATAGCTSATVVAGGSALPSNGVTTSGYGWRADPLSGERKFHNGLDFSAGCGEPIWAAANGAVTRVFTDQYDGWIIEVDHGGGVIAWYVHSFGRDILVQADQVVTAGQQIARIGTSGYSTGCHLHFEVKIDGENVDPALWLANAGLPVA